MPVLPYACGLTDKADKRIARLNRACTWAWVTIAARAIHFARGDA